jgi:flagellar hook-associated protein 1 FlgK
MSLNSIMQIGLSGMFTASTSMQTTSHNIANSGSLGYTRQRVLSGANFGQLTTFGVLGTGAKVQTVDRMTDSFLVDRLRDQGAALSQFDTVDLAMGDVEGIFGSMDNNHLGTAMSEFFNAWSSLATPPVTPALQQSVVDSGVRLAADIGAMSNQLNNLANDLDAQLEAGVNELNNLLQNVADLNRQILVSESQSATANDLRDQRDAMLDQISQLSRADVIERDDGSVDVILGGRTVVTREHVQKLEVRRAAGDGTGAGVATVTVNDGRLNVALPAGRLQGLLEARDDQVLKARERLDGVARQLIERVNELHIQGRSGGGSGFLFFTGDTAATIGVSDALKSDVSLVGYSRSGLSGDTDIAREIAALGQTGGQDGVESLTDIYHSLIVGIASDASASRYRLEGQNSLVETLSSRLEGVRGVSLDEEAANLAMFQNAYEANARVISTVQEMFDTILMMV